jgi:hypothetical protein
MSTVMGGKVRRHGPGALSVGIALSVGVGFFVTAPETAALAPATRATASVATLSLTPAAARFLESAKLTARTVGVSKPPGR